MNIEKLITKWQDKHHELLSEYSKGDANNKVMQMYRSQMKDVLEIINDLKAINSEDLKSKQLLKIIFNSAKESGMNTAVFNTEKPKHLDDLYADIINSDK